MGLLRSVGRLAFRSPMPGRRRLRRPLVNLVTSPPLAALPVRLPRPGSPMAALTTRTTALSLRGFARLSRRVSTLARSCGSTSLIATWRSRPWMTRFRVCGGVVFSTGLPAGSWSWRPRASLRNRSSPSLRVREVYLCWFFRSVSDIVSSRPLIRAPTTTPSICRICIARSSFITSCTVLWLSGRSSTWRSSIRT